MEELRLSETERRYFGDLFLCCDEEANGKAPLLKAKELFRSAGIGDDVLDQIADLCFPHTSSTNLTHINKKQFYSALKLIAAHQANMPLGADLLTNHLDLPLPRFTWNLICEPDPDLIQLSSSPVSGVREKEIRVHHKRDKSFGSYEPMRLSSNSSDIDVPPLSLRDNIEAQSTDSEVESETISQNSEQSHTMRAKNGSPWSTASESPTPTNSVAEQRAQGFLGPHGSWNTTGGVNRDHWPPAPISEEHTQLLGTEEESSDRHSSDDEGGDIEGDGRRFVWRISPEQRLHYISQFHLLQPDTNGLVPGKIARRFFEKSRLPVSDLHKIWLLSDVTKDGALCIEEFITAMHLVVLRRKDISVPNILPQCLVPKVHRSPHSPEQIVTTNLVDIGTYANTNISGEFNQKLTNSSVQNSKSLPNDVDSFEGKNLLPINLDSPPSINSPISNTDNTGRTKPEALSGNKEWTKFIDSPTSSISSPGPKPVNFDFHKSAVERDPKIFHPVPLRVTPEASSLPVQASESGGASPRKIDDIVYNFQDSYDIASPKKLSAQLSCDINSLPSVQASSAEFKPIQRPQAKKAVMKNIGALPPPPTKETPAISEDPSGPVSLQYAPKKDPPPPPPPRPLRTHTRSSSLDLNRFKGTHSATTCAPPQVPPRVSPSITSPKKLINQRSEGDVLGLIPDPPFSPCDAFGQSVAASQINPPEETFANFAQFQNNLPIPIAESSAINLPRGRSSFEDNEAHVVPRKHGAFEVYRKPTPRSSESPDGGNPTDASNPLAIKSDESLKRLQEQNVLLCRLCQQLSLELADIQRERETLRLRLETNSTTV